MTSRPGRDLLDVTRMDAGRLTVAPDCISAVQIISSDCVEAERRLLASASLPLELDV
jgi:hypothetical protein